MFKFNAVRASALAIAMAGSTVPHHAVLADEEDTAPSQAPMVLNPLVVTATGFAVPKDDLGNSVSVITKQEIEEQHFRTLPEALRTVPGMAVVQSGPIGTQTSVFTRGGNSNQTLILLNGRPIGDPSTPNGQIDLAGIPLANVDRIEVVRGPGASIYGSQAQAGVINIITSRGEGPTKVMGEAEFGTQNTFNQTANVSGAAQNIGYDVTFNHLRSSGFNITPERFRPPGTSSESDGFRDYNGSVALDATLAEGLTGQAYFGIVNTRLDLDTSPDDPNAEQKTLNYFIDASLAGEYYDGVWRPTLAFGFSDFDRRTTNEPDANSTTIVDTKQTGNRIDVDLRNDFYIGNHSIVTLGGNVERESFNQTGFSDFSGFVISDDSDASRMLYAGYLQHRFSYEEWFSLTSNVRGNIVEDSGNAVTFSVTPLVRVQQTGTTFHGSVGTGFQAPSLFELFGFSPTSFDTAFRGNPNLDPERNFSWEVGARQDFFGGDLGIGATYFNNNFKDAIVTVFDTSFNSTTVNIQDIKAQGVETFIETTPFETLYFRIDYTFTDSELQDDDPTTPRQALRRPKHQINAVAAYDVTDYFQLAANLLTVAGRQDIGLFGGFVDPKPYTIVNASANFQVLENLEAYVQVNNLTNTQYEPAVGFAGPGAQGIFGVRARF